MTINIEKLWAEATIRNNFIFSRTMEMFPDICRELLEIILHIKIKELRYPEREKTIEARTDSKGIRLDIFVEDAGGKRWFDVEMQVCDYKSLAKRVRYYQGLIDIDRLKHGQSYEELEKSFIIFICPFDHFKQGRHIYTFRERCDQDTKILLGDGATKIFLNSKGTLDDVDDETKAILDFVESGIVKSLFVEKLATAVEIIKTNEKVRHDFMTFEMFLLSEKRKAKEEERENIVLRLLRRGRPFEEIHEDTELPLQRIRELAEKVSVTDTAAKNF